MHTTFEIVTEYIALGAEIISILLIALGCIDAAARIGIGLIGRRLRMRTAKDIWLRLAGWILLSLEFALAADLARTSISPGWEDIGQLAAIAAIRTVLSVFLERDLSEFERKEPASSAA
jgi:uncharacterized membrane protein